MVSVTSTVSLVQSGTVTIDMIAVPLPIRDGAGFMTSQVMALCMGCDVGDVSELSLERGDPTKPGVGPFARSSTL